MANFASHPIHELARFDKRRTPVARRRSRCYTSFINAIGLLQVLGLTLLTGCNIEMGTATVPAKALVQLPAHEKRVPENINERVAILRELGFVLDHQGADYVQYAKGSITVDLDTDDDGIHVTPIDRNADRLTDEMLRTAHEVYTLLGLELSGLTYHITPSDGIGPEIHRTKIRGWTITKRVWPKGVVGMYVAFSAEKRTD